MKKTWMIVGHCLCALGLGLVFGGLVMVLWNGVLPGLLGVSAIGFWQAVGLLILCQLLFGRLGSGIHPFMGGRHRHRNHFREKWQRMSDEERRAFMAKHHWGHSFKDCLHRDADERQGE
jgi:hypothetical protein